jgi:hypothetical protein
MTDVKQRQKWAIGALDAHEESYGREVTGALRKLWETGEPWKYAAATLNAKIPGWGESSWQLLVAPPSWAAIEPLGLDDAVVGPRGDWTHAGDFLPIFRIKDETAFIVAALEPPHAVGWFHEEAWQSTAGGYRDGVFVLADSLHGFLKTLGEAERTADDAEAGDDDDDTWDSVGGDDP